MKIVCNNSESFTRTVLQMDQRAFSTTKFLPSKLYETWMLEKRCTETTEIIINLTVQIFNYTLYTNKMSDVR